MSYLLDADFVINALARKRRAHVTIDRLAPHGIAISWATVGEIYEVAFRSPHREAHLSAFREFLCSFRMLGLNDPVMERFAEVRALLRHRGEMIPDLDILLGATALNYDLTVLTYNVSHISRIPDLKLYQAGQHDT